MVLLDYNGQPRQGVHRPSQEQNPLLHREQLGEPKPTTFISRTAPSDFTFGLPKHRDEEGARDGAPVPSSSYISNACAAQWCWSIYFICEKGVYMCRIWPIAVTTSWKEHKQSVDTRGGPNYVTMNKLAAIGGKTMANEQHEFRQTHFVPLRRGDTGSRLGQKHTLPSDMDPNFKYGRASDDRPLEERRLTGYTPSMRSLLQGDFYDEWIRMNQRRAQQFAQKVQRPPPKATRASLGHSVQYNDAKRAYITKSPATADEQRSEQPHTFKMSRFNKIESVIKRRGDDTRLHKHGAQEVSPARETVEEPTFTDADAQGHEDDESDVGTDNETDGAR